MKTEWEEIFNIINKEKLYILTAQQRPNLPLLTQEATWYEEQYNSINGNDIN